MPFTLPSGSCSSGYLKTFLQEDFRKSCQGEAYHSFLRISEFRAQQAAHFIPAASKSASSGPNITEFPQREWILDNFIFAIIASSFVTILKVILCKLIC